MRGVFAIGSNTKNIRIGSLSTMKIALVHMSGVTDCDPPGTGTDVSNYNLCTALQTMLVIMFISHVL